MKRNVSEIVKPRPESWSPLKKIFRSIPAAIAFSVITAFPALANTEIHFLDVGQGLSILIGSEGHYMLYDGGDRDKSSFVVAYLQKEGVSSLDYVVASHYDSDHLNGIVGALHAFPVKQVYSPNYKTTSDIFESFDQIVASKGIPRSQPSVGTAFQVGDAKITVLGPVGSDYEIENNYSIAVRVQDGNKSILITGDAEAQSEAEMLAAGQISDADVYVAGHHGSATSTSWALLQAAAPQAVVISCGAENQYGCPSADTLTKIQTIGADLYRTDKQGSIKLAINDDQLTWNVDPTSDYTPGTSTGQAAQPQVNAGSDSSAAPAIPVQSNTAIVYWTPNGKSYHADRNCATLKRSKTILSGALAESGKTDSCNVCVK